MGREDDFHPSHKLHVRAPPGGPPNRSRMALAVSLGDVTDRATER